MSNNTFNSWKSSTNCIFWGIVVLSVFGWIAGLLGGLTGFTDFVMKVESFFHGVGRGSDDISNAISDAASGFYGVYYAMQIITLTGWGCYLYGLNDFKTIQPTDHTERLVGKINTACWLGVTALLISLVSGKMNLIFMVLFAILGWVLTLVSYIKLQSAFAELKHCGEWNDKAREGAGNLRLSANLNIWLIFWPVVCLGVALAIGGVAWSHAKYVKDHAMDYAFSGGLNSLKQTVENYETLLITLGVLLGLSALVMSIMQFVLRLMGWRKIHNGFLAENAAATGQPAAADPVANSGFCHKCGNPLSPDAGFCPKCGEKRIVVSESVSVFVEQPANAAETTLLVDAGDEETGAGESEEKERKRKILLLGSIGFGALVLFLVFWFALSRKPEKDGKVNYVFTESSGIYDTPSDYGEMIRPLEFGQQVDVLEEVNGGGWAKVKYKGDDGKSKTGYVPLHTIAGDFQFGELLKAGLDKEHVRRTTSIDEERIALSDWFTKHTYDSIKTTSPTPEGVCIKSGVVDGQMVVAFIAGDKILDDKLVVYTFDGDRVPRLYSDYKIMKDTRGIEKITGTKNDIRVLLLSSTDYEEEHADEWDPWMDNVQESDYEGSGEGNDYTDVFTGTIDGKYEIEMTLTSDGGAYYTGEYFYTKNKTPIQLRGQLTDDNEHLVLEEYVGLNMTGKFEGTLTRDSYYGTWTNADGDKSMPFKIFKK